MLTVDDLMDDFKIDLKNGNIGDIRKWLDNEIDNAVVYTSDCYDILKELGISSFDEYIAEFGEVTSISSLAWYYLRESILSEIDLNDLEAMKDLYERYEELKIESEAYEEEDENLEEIKREMNDIEEELASEYNFEL